MGKGSRQHHKSSNLLNLSEFCKGQSWLIYPPVFEQMYRRLVQENAAGGLTRLAVDFNRPVVEKDYYDLVGDVAVIDIAGSLTKKAGFSFFFFGGTTYGYVQTAVKEALADGQATSILLRVDSPGGVVNGVEETGQVIYNARGDKPVVAFVDGWMMSAAYWIGSAADEIVAGSTSEVGSIGVLMVHEDWSKWNEKYGIDVTYLTAGKYKALGNPDEPLSDLARETFQAELDYLYTMFVETVAAHREVETADVLQNMADGRSFIGRQALDAGLVDSIGNLESALDRAHALAGDGKFKFTSTKGDTQMAKDNEKTITLELLANDAPDLLKQIRAEAAETASKAAADATYQEAFADGVNAERGRVLEILGAEADGEQTLTAIKDGIEANAAFKLFYEAEKAKKAAGLQELEGAAPDSAGQEDPQELEDDEQPKDEKTARRQWRPQLGPAAA